MLCGSLLMGGAPVRVLDPSGMFQANMAGIVHT